MQLPTQNGWNLPRNNMSENPIAISNINDFIFCPVSIYFHSLDAETENLLYQCEDQINGSASHEASDKGMYSSKRNVLQAIWVYCDKYSLSGKIDLFDVDTGVLTERKRKITTIYDGYVFQLYAQYFALSEMGYTVRKLRLYSILDNKSYDIKLPENDMEMFMKFENTIQRIKNFNMDNYKQDNPLKCKRCIYEPMCVCSEKEE